MYRLVFVVVLILSILSIFYPFWTMSLFLLFVDDQMNWFIVAVIRRSLETALFMASS